MGVNVPRRNFSAERPYCRVKTIPIPTIHL